MKGFGLLGFLPHYIDPGTGSMLFTVLIGLISAGVYALRSAVVKLRFVMSGGRASEAAEDVAPFVIFTDSKRYWNVFQPICDEFEARGVELTYLTASPDDPALSSNYQHVTCEFAGEGNKAFAKLNMLKADIVLSSTPGLDVFQWKRSRDVKWYAHILHAVSDASMYRMFGIDYYDAVLLTGEHQAKQVRALEELRNLPPKELPIVGLTYMDAMLERLHAAEQSPGIEQATRPSAPQSNGMQPPCPNEMEAPRSASHSADEMEAPRPASHAEQQVASCVPTEVTVLLAPSWGASSIFSLYGGELIDALLQTGYHVIVRPHPQSFESEKELMDTLMRDYPASDQLEWNRDNDNFEVLRRSSIMVSDFSGVVFDFALVLDRPVIYTQPEYDKGPYDAWWLDEEPWTFTTLPKIGRQLNKDNAQNLKQLIDECLTDPSFQKARDEARAECWSCRGTSAQAVVDYLMAKRVELVSTPAEPASTSEDSASTPTELASASEESASTPTEPTKASEDPTSAPAEPASVPAAELVSASSKPVSVSAELVSIPDDSTSAPAQE